MTIFISEGLDDSLLPYIHNFVEQGINGHRLLSASVEDLEIFRIDKLGHQEIFMSAVDLLRDFVISFLVFMFKNDFCDFFCFSSIKT